MKLLMILLLAAFLMTGSAAALQRCSKRSISNQPTPLHSLFPAAHLQGYEEET